MYLEQRIVKMRHLLAVNLFKTHVWQQLLVNIMLRALEGGKWFIALRVFMTCVPPLLHVDCYGAFP
jgi:hypothetical protein